jgi:hypothetical protein
MDLNGKMKPVETVPRMGVKENDEGDEFRWYTLRNCVNVTMYPQYNN